MTTDSLTEREQAVLDFERDWAANHGEKAARIRAVFGFTPARYYQLLTGLVSRPAAADYDPLLVRRLRRRQAERAHRASSPPAGGQGSPERATK